MTLILPNVTIWEINDLYINMDTYKTNSLPLASFLSCHDDLKFKGVDREDINKIYFIFEPRITAQELSDKYFSGQSSVEPLELFKNYRVLKDLVFEARRNQKNN